ncbi:MAG: Rne/Rng family ribonuclease [Planctomycetes bacterium]|nr:Rne/Rng family ribonuclease [Planctomycetota bacterium]
MSRSGNMLVVNARDPEEVRIALLDQGQICDLRSGRPDAGSMVGNIYLGVVKQVEDSLDAAFVDFGDRRAGFLHVGNVHPAYLDPSADAMAAATAVIERPERVSEEGAAQAEVEEKEATAETTDAEQVEEADAEAEFEAPARNRISDLLKVGRQVVVQVVRDPVRGKGATLSTIISLAGFGLVWMPSLGRIGVSRRIEETEERERLREILTELGGGAEMPVIARTAAAGEPKRVLQADMTRIQKRISNMTKTASAAQAPALLVEEETIVMRAIRELFHAGIDKIQCDEQKGFESIAAFLERKAATERVELRLYEDDVPLFEQLGLETDYQRLFRSRVPIGRGASIVIHPTEALTAIDVNSGRVEGTTLEETALETNLLAAKEVANQVRLRDLGGIIVVDFIDMRSPDNRRQVEESMREALQGDRARMKTGRIGSFGLFSFTRRRLGTGPARAADAMCRSCGGSGNYAHHSAGALRVLRRLRALTGAWQVRIRAQEGVVHQLRRHQNALQDLPHKVEFVEDLQVPSGESVLEPITALADAPDPR